MTIQVGTEIWIQEPAGVEPTSFIYSCNNSRAIEPMDGISVTWGKTDFLDSPPAAVAKFTLKDPGTYWLDRIKANSVVGRAVNFYAKPNDGTGDWFWFRGRITALDVKRGPVDERTGQPKFYLLNFTAADKTADFGNIIMPAQATWPAQTMLDIAIAIRNAALPSTTIADFFFDPAHVAHTTAPFACGGKNIQELTDMFYRSEGFTWSYLPSQNTVRHQRRLGNTTGGSVPPCFYWIDSRGLIISRPASMTWNDSTYGDVTYRGMYLNSCTLQADYDNMYIPEGAGINRVECDYSYAPSYLKNTFSTFFSSDVTDGYRTLKYDSFLSTTANVTDANNVLWYTANQEAQDAQHPSVVYDTKLTGGFDNIRDARNLIEAGIKPLRVTLGGSPWCSWMNEAVNMFQIIGGTIRYVDKRWVFDLTLNTLKPDAHASATWDAFPTNIKWGDGAVTAGNYNLAPELTWADSRWFGKDTVINTPALTP